MKLNFYYGSAATQRLQRLFRFSQLTVFGSDKKCGTWEWGKAGEWVKLAVPFFESLIMLAGRPWGRGIQWRACQPHL